MRYVFFDTETSGLSDRENTILSLSYQVIDSDTWEKLKERNYYFAWPQDESRVSKEAITINGLTKEFLSKQELSNPKDALTEFILDVKTSNLIVAHNLRFDQGFIEGACIEYGVDFCQDSWTDTYDTMLEMTNYCGINNEFGSGYKWPKLKELAQILQIDYSDIEFHTSSADVELTKRCFKEIIDQGLYVSNEKDSLTLTAGLKVNSATDIKVLYFMRGRLVSEDYVPVKQRKMLKQKLYAKWAIENEKRTEDIVRGYKKAPHVKSKNDFLCEKEHITCPTYKREKFTILPLSKEEIRCQLAKEAEQKFHSIFFWKNKSNRREYVATNLESRYEIMMREYQTTIARFEKEQDEKEKIFNKQAQNEYQQKLVQYQKLIDGDKDFLMEKLSQLPRYVSYPLEMTIIPKIGQDSNVVDLNFQLPNIDEMPRFSATRTSSGTYKIKELKKTDVQTYYIECVIGLGFFFAACGFNVSPCIKQINIRAYLLGFNPIGGNIEKDIYTLNITRDQIYNIDFNHLCPVEALTYFSHTYNMPKDLYPTPLITPIIESSETEELDDIEVKTLDPIFPDVARYVVSNQVASASRFQDEFSIGNNRGRAIMSQLEAKGIVGPSKGSHARDILITDINSLEQLLQQLGV